jgi:hypothetical protein
MIVIFVLMLFVDIIKTDKCNPLATLTEIDTFYYSQPYTRHVRIDIGSYVKAFPRLGTLIPTFNKALSYHDTDEKLDAQEPVTLLPFTNELNAYIVKESTLGKNAFQACASNGGNLIRLDASNRDALVNILKNNGIDKTPVHVLPHFSMLSFNNFEPLLTPDTVDAVGEGWQKSPPWITKENKLEFPPNKITLNGVETSSEPEHFKSFVICQKTKNPWDDQNARKDWFQTMPKIKTALSLLGKLKTAYEISSKSLRSIPPVTNEVSKIIKLILPEPFNKVLDFLDRFSNNATWDKATNLNQFHLFINTALKLVRQFNLNPDSITKLPSTNVKFSPISIDELNWRQSFGLDEDVYGITGPLIIRPTTSYKPESDTSPVPSYYDATISARVYNRKTDKITLYSVTPNPFNGKTTTIKTVVVTSKLKIALEQDVKPLQCSWAEVEHFKVCHSMPLQPVISTPMSSLMKCAEALLSEKYSEDFLDCPKKSIQVLPSIHRANCDPDDQPTVILNSDSPIQIEFRCDGVTTTTKNISSFPTLIPTSCEVRIVEGTSSRLAFPQWNPDFLQDPSVGEQVLVNIPAYEMPQNLVIIISVALSISCVMLMALIISLIYCCCKCCCKKQNNVIANNHDEDAELYLPAIRLRELPFSN